MTVKYYKYWHFRWIVYFLTSVIVNSALLFIDEGKYELDYSSYSKFEILIEVNYILCFFVGQLTVDLIFKKQQPSFRNLAKIILLGHVFGIGYLAISTLLYSILSLLIQ